MATAFLRATTTSDKIEYFNVSNILSIQPDGETTKILMGANMYWRVYTDSIQFVNLESLYK